MAGDALKCSVSFNQLVFPKKRGVEVCERALKKVGREGRRESERQRRREGGVELGVDGGKC